MARHRYIKTGRCIWCGRTEADGATFYTRPHIVPHGLGGDEIGVDVCDDCNHYFGKAPKAGTPSIDLAFKEIYNAFIKFGDNLNENTYKHLNSAFFEYRHSKHTIRVKTNFSSYIITKQFKRGLYEVFLQKYHYVTGKGNHPMFDAVRKYARYGIGDLHVYYAFNNVILVPKEDQFLKISMADSLLVDMMEFGMYAFWMAGHEFFLEVLPIAFKIKGNSYLQKEAQRVLIPAKGNESIFEMKDVTQLDIFMQRFNGE